MEEVCSIQCVCNGADGSSSCVLLSVERLQRYSSDRKVVERLAFNCSEAYQRYCGEHGIKLGKLSGLMLTGLGAYEVAGMAGVIFSAAECGVAALTVAGPVLE